MTHCCSTCGDILEARTYDYGRCSQTGYSDSGEYLYCDTCRHSVDEGDCLENGPEAERLRERREAEIESAQYQQWMESLRDGYRLGAELAATTRIGGWDDGDVESAGGGE